MKINDAIKIVGTGGCTAVGACAASSAAAVRALISGYAMHPYLLDTDNEPICVAMAPYIPYKVHIADRFHLLLQSAMEEVMETLSNAENIFAISAIIGLPPARPGLPDDLATQIKTRLEQSRFRKRRMSSVEIISKGHAAGFMALETACRKLENQDMELCLIGGVDSYLAPETLLWLEENDLLHNAGVLKNPYGFVPGEAAGLCLLASANAAEKYKLKILADVVSIGSGHERNLANTDNVCIGEGLTASFHNALESVAPDIKIDHLICDLNGETYRADEFGFALTRTSGYFKNSKVFQCPARAWGDIGAASGPLFINLAIAAGQKGYAKGRYTLLSTSSVNGEKAAVVVDVPVNERQ